MTRTPYTPGARQAKAEIPTDEQRVKAVYSDARWACVDEGRRLWAILGKRIGHLWRQVQLCEGLAQDKEAHGWKVAASNLPTPLPAEGVALPKVDITAEDERRANEGYQDLGDGDRSFYAEKDSDGDSLYRLAEKFCCRERQLIAEITAKVAALSESAALRKQLEETRKERDEIHTANFRQAAKINEITGARAAFADTLLNLFGYTIYTEAYENASIVDEVKATIARAELAEARISELEAKLKETL